MQTDLMHSRRQLLLSASGCAAALLLSGCASAPGHAPTISEPRPGSTRRVSALTDEQAFEVSLLAMSLHGTPYRFGGNTPQGGFDCSGFIGYVFWNAAKLRTPRTVRELFAWFGSINAEQARSGDLVFFGRREPTHAGIIVDQDRFIHAPSTGGTVRMDRLSSAYWARERI